MTRGLRFLILIFLVTASLLIIVGCAGSAVQVKGTSMEPAIKDGQRIAVSRDAYRNASPQRGDIILFKRNGVQVIRRVVGLPGETITFQGCSVYVNGTKLDEPYLPPGTCTESTTATFALPNGSYFIMADNRKQGADSRSYGPITGDDIIGKVVQ